MEFWHKKGGGVIKCCTNKSLYVQEVWRFEANVRRLDNMDRIWILIWIVPALGLSSSNTTTFLISAPGMLHAGAPTPLAVTLFSDSSASVTAEVEHGNTKIALTQNIQGGSTSVVYLPPLPGSIPHNSLLKLNVWGNKDNQIVFTNTTNVTFSHRNVSSFIQTDRSSYRPGHTIKIRVVSLQLDNHPYRGKLKISLQASHYSLNLVEFQVPKNVFLNVGSDEGLYEAQKIY
ncbi:CD109 antigen-like [Oryzias melastigma]|uniref:CD109 antigen-like n=1 Tax=Oryzias melastigma TaxID=30732 RepID=UPI00168D3864|nr:CD109 antigen-like [Oryzias melastigma]